MVTNLNILGVQTKGQAKNELVGEDIAEDGKFNLYKLTLIEALAKKKKKKKKKKERKKEKKTLHHHHHQQQQQLNNNR